MQEDIRTELTSMKSGFEDSTPDKSPNGDDQGIDEVPELIERSIAGNDDDDDFEFKFEGIDRESDWFPQGEVFPIFDRKLLSERDAMAIENDQLQIVRSAMKNLFIVDDRSNATDDDAELNGIASENYCVWTPGNSPQASPARCKKSSSTGTTSGKRWGMNSLKELLIRRSRSDGKKSLVRFGSWKKKSEMAAENAEADVKQNTNAAEKVGGEKRRATYLPYRKAIIGFGFYPSVNGFGGLNKTRPPF